MLVDEADALRIEALFRANHRDEASTRAAAFVSTHRDSPLAPRVRALLVRYGPR
jgi:hypothetical protein